MISSNRRKHSAALLSVSILCTALARSEGPSTAVQDDGRAAKESSGEANLPWSFQPLSDPAPPGALRAEWTRSPIDSFILAALEERGIAPAPPAGRRTLIRRATFDLTGLPPEPEAVAAFLADPSSDDEAFARVVDRLLASPRYGERWGRHWLDVARYADSNGMDENLAHANAYRYRDAVIAAFNRDEPFDRFLEEQVAGDLLPAPADEAAERERIVLTGFLSLGPKMLAEDDPRKMEMDIVDEQVDTIGRAFLGLSLGCARCHDHKFDPIPSEDYYALAGILKGTRTMENFKVVARWAERPIASPAEIARRAAAEKALAEREGELAAVRRDAGGAILAREKLKAAAYLAAARLIAEGHAREARWKGLAESPAAERAPGLLLLEAESYARGNLVKDFTVYGNPIGVIYNRGEIPNVAEYDLEAPRAGPYRLDLRYAAAEARPVRILVNGKLARAAAAGRATGGWTPESQAWEAAGIVPLQRGKNLLRLERDGPFPHLDQLALAPAEGIEEPPPPLDDLARERGLEPLFLRQWVEHLERGGEKTSVAKIEAAGGGGSGAGAALAAIATLVADPQGPFRVPAGIAALYPAETAARVRELEGEVSSRRKELPELPMAMAVGEGKPEDLRVHLRGSYLTLAQTAPRHFPRALAGERQAPLPADRSGRLELALWLASAENPLTARVIVNRIWHWHFGAGIVRTTDNFGRLGEAPSHPALLDWLARRFIASGWSMKGLHRTILLSAVYRESSRRDERAELLDPENRLRWRWGRKRLEAEAIRDAILWVSGGLELTAGGTLLATRDHEYVASTASTNSTSYRNGRRSVYQPVIRSAVYELFQAFDFADPSTLNGARDSTTVAPQALFLLNGELVHDAARAWASHLLREPLSSDAERIDRAFRRAFARPPEGGETASARAFLENYRAALKEEGTPEPERPAKSWEAYLRSLLATSEFIYVE